MKKLFLILLIAVLIAGALLGYAAFRAGDIARIYKPQLEDALSGALNTPVTLGDIEVSVFPPVALRASKISVGSTGSISAGALEARVAPMALLSGTLRIGSLNVVQPKLTVERTSEGFAVSGIGKAPRQDEKPKADDKDGLAIELEQFNVRGGRLEYRDHVSGTAHEFSNLAISSALSAAGGVTSAENLTLSAEHEQAGKLSVSIDSLTHAKAGNLLKLQNARIQLGKSEVLAGGTLALTEVKGDLRLSGAGLNLESLIQYGIKLPAEVTDLRGMLAPNVKLAFSGAPGRPKITGEIALAGVGLSYAGLPIKEISGTVKMAPGTGLPRLHWSAVSAQLGQPASKVKLSGSFEPESLLLKTTVNAERLDLAALQPVLNRFTPPVLALKPQGLLEVTLDAVLRGSTLDNLAGKVTLREAEITPPTFEKVNLLGQIDLHYASEGGLRVKSEKLTLSSSGITASISGDMDPLALKGKMRVSADKLSMERVAAIAARFKPEIGKYDLRGNAALNAELALAGKKFPAMEGNLNLDKAALRAGSLEIADTSGLIKFTTHRNGTRFSGPKLRSTLAGQPLHYNLDLLAEPDALTLGGFDGSGLGGQFRIQGKLRYAPGSPFSGKINFSGMDIEQLMRLLPGGAKKKITGKIERFDLDLNGDFAGGGKSVDGGGVIRVVDGMLHDINIGRVVLEKLSAIPLIGAEVLRGVPPEFGPYFKNNNTPIKELDSDLALRRGVLSAKRLRVVSDMFRAAGSGDSTLEGDVDFKGELVFIEELSLALVRKIKELGALLTRRRELSIPLSMTGRVPDLTVLPDVQGLLQKGASKAIEQALGEALGLGGKQRRPPREGPPPREDRPAKAPDRGRPPDRRRPPPNPVGDLLEGLLREGRR